MRLFEAIIDANHRAIAGDPKAGLRPADFESELPIVALTCIDPRLNPLIPEVLGVPEEQFIWLRNAGNILTGPFSSTMRSLALACAIKGGREIVLIGHTDCLVGKTSTLQLIERFAVLGIERNHLPDNLNEYFGTFSSERQNVIKGADIIRSSPLIGPNVPVHGLVVDIGTGKLEWLVNGYETLGRRPSKLVEATQSASQALNALKQLTDFRIGSFDLSQTKIGEAVRKADSWVTQKREELQAHSEPSPAEKPGPPPKIPLPPPLRASLILRKGRK